MHCHDLPYIGRAQRIKIIRNYLEATNIFRIGRTTRGSTPRFRFPWGKKTLRRLEKVFISESASGSALRNLLHTRRSYAQKERLTVTDPRDSRHASGLHPMGQLPCKNLFKSREMCFHFTHTPACLSNAYRVDPIRKTMRKLSLLR